MQARARSATPMERMQWWMRPGPRRPYRGRGDGVDESQCESVMSRVGVRERDQKKCYLGEQLESNISFKHIWKINGFPKVVT